MNSYGFWFHGRDARVDCLRDAGRGKVWRQRQSDRGEIVIWPDYKGVRGEKYAAVFSGFIHPMAFVMGWAGKDPPGLGLVVCMLSMVLLTTAMHLDHSNHSTHRHTSHLVTITTRLSLTLARRECHSPYHPTRHHSPTRPRVRAHWPDDDNNNNNNYLTLDHSLTLERSLQNPPCVHRNLLNPPLTTPNLSHGDASGEGARRGNHRNEPRVYYNPQQTSTTVPWSVSFLIHPPPHSSALLSPMLVLTRIAASRTSHSRSSVSIPPVIVPTPRAIALQTSSKANQACATTCLHSRIDRRSRTSLTTPDPHVPHAPCHGSVAPVLVSGRSAQTSRIQGDKGVHPGERETTDQTDLGRRRRDQRPVRRFRLELVSRGQFRRKGPCKADHHRAELAPEIVLLLIASTRPARFTF